MLHYSAKTIEVCMSRLYQEVGCHSRLELVLAAVRGQKDLSPDVQDVLSGQWPSPSWLSASASVPCPAQSSRRSMTSA